jgi:hypothetical protein
MDSGRVRTLVWLEPRQVAMVRRVLASAGLECAAVGCPEAGRAAELARDLASAGAGAGGAEGGGVSAVRDLRAALAGAPGGEDVDLVWLATGAGLGDDESGVVEALRACAGRGVKVASAEPVPASLLAPVADGPGVAAAATASFVVPTWRASAGLRAGADALGSFGPVVSASVTWLSGRGAGEEAGAGASLAAMLLDALDVLDVLVGEPAKIDGAYVDVSVGRPGVLSRPAPGETLRGLSGGFTAAARTEDGRGAVVHASDCASVWRREVVAVGPGGTLRFSDDGLEWRGADGRIVERSGEYSPAGVGGGVGEAGTSAEMALSASLAWMVRGEGAAVGGVSGAGGVGAMPSPGAVQRVRTTAGAALLSARTGQNESPAVIARMTGGS